MKLISGIMKPASPRTVRTETSCKNTIAYTVDTSGFVSEKGKRTKRDRRGTNVLTCVSIMDDEMDDVNLFPHFEEGCVPGKWSKKYYLTEAEVNKIVSCYRIDSETDEIH